MDGYTSETLKNGFIIRLFIEISTKFYDAVKFISDRADYHAAQLSHGFELSSDVSSKMNIMILENFL